MPTEEEKRRARHTICSYMHWGEPPEAQAGMGGIFTWLGESEYGRLNYPYTNWLQAYRLTMESLLDGDGPMRAGRAWPDHLARTSRPADTPGGGGADKALLVWDRHVVPSVRQWLEDPAGRSSDMERYDYVRGIQDDLLDYLQAERRRLNAPRDWQR